jgi:hypothetical protein
MSELSHSDLIWNRACGAEPMRCHPGDRALAGLLQSHGLAMNGGVIHAVECLTTEELADAKAGYRFYELHDVASLLSRANAILEQGDALDDHEVDLDGQYLRLIPSDSSLVERFEK